MRMYMRLLFGLVGRALRSRNDLLMEDLVLRQQLAVYARRQTRHELHNEDRASRRWPRYQETDESTLAIVPEGQLNTPVVLAEPTHRGLQVIAVGA